MTDAEIEIEILGENIEVYIKYSTELENERN